MKNMRNVLPVPESVEPDVLAMTCAPDAEAIARHSRRGIRFPRAGDDVPPFSFLRPDMTPEQAAVDAVREMRIHSLMDALAVLWELRRAVREAANEAEVARGIATPRKNQQRAARKSLARPSSLLDGLQKRLSADAF